LPVAQSVRIAYYGLHLRFDLVGHSVSGFVIVRCAREPRPRDAVWLDLDSTMHVDSALIDGHRTTVTHVGPRLGVVLPTGESPSPPTVAIHYHGIPSGDALVFERHADQPVISSYGLPYSARAWWPCLDSPAAKADSADIEINAPATLVVASNGRFVSRHENLDGTATTLWSVRYPIYADVIAVAISNYDSFTLVYHPGHADSLAMPFFVFPEDIDKARQDFGVLPAMLASFVTRFGPYPFMGEKYGVVEMAQHSFREHQTVPGYGPQLITGDHHNDWILAHELAHQWFGNALTVRNWSHVWLNEGFATYASLLWREQTTGEADYLAAARAWMVPETYAGALYVPDSGNVDEMFTHVTFRKGALVLHMLRHVMGDSAFFRALRHYVLANMYRTVTTDSFERAAEDIYGRPLDWFFQEWVYHGGAPEYDVSEWTSLHDQRGYHVAIAIRQGQEASVFRMPLDVLLTTRTGSARAVVLDSLRVQRFTVDAPDSVTAVSIDPDGWVIKASVRPAEHVHTGL